MFSSNVKIVSPKMPQKPRPDLVVNPVYEYGIRLAAPPGTTMYGSPNTPSWEPSTYQPRQAKRPTRQIQTGGLGITGAATRRMTNSGGARAAAAIYRRSNSVSSQESETAHSLAADIENLRRRRNSMSSPTMDQESLTRAALLEQQIRESEALAIEAERRAEELERSRQAGSLLAATVAVDAVEEEAVPLETVVSHPAVVQPVDLGRPASVRRETRRVKTKPVNTGFSITKSARFRMETKEEEVTSGNGPIYAAECSYLGNCNCKKCVDSRA